MMMIIIFIIIIISTGKTEKLGFWDVNNSTYFKHQ